MHPEVGGLRRRTDPQVTASEKAVQRQEEAKDTALKIASAALDKKALQVEIIDVRGKVDYADYVVLMSGRSDRQVSAIANGIQVSLKHEHGQKCLSTEGLPTGQWVLMDYADVIVHIFHEDTRGYYDLEALWIDAARVELDLPEEKPAND